MSELALKESGGGSRKDDELMMVGAHCFVFFGALGIGRASDPCKPVSHIHKGSVLENKLKKKTWRGIGKPKHTWKVVVKTGELIQVNTGELFI